MALKSKSGATKGSLKRPSKSALSASPSKVTKRKTPTAATPATQHKPKPTSASTKRRKPPHLRYNEKELGVPKLNGIRPAGVQKLPNKKKGKQFVEDGEGMRTILAMVMAEKEGNIESKMMRARQLEEIREAKRAEAEKRAEGKKASLEEKKSEIKSKRRRKGSGPDYGKRESESTRASDGVPAKKAKRVSFG